MEPLHRYAFIHIPKTAGSTLRHILRQNFGAQHCDIKVPPKVRASRPWTTEVDMALALKAYPRLAGVCGHRVTCFSGMENALPGLRYFTLLREPKARFISHFHHVYGRSSRACNLENLREFAREDQYRDLQSRWLCGRNDSEDAIRAMTKDIDIVGLTEQFDMTLLMLADWLGLPDDCLPYKSRNRSTIPATLDYSDAEVDEVITEANRHDIAVYEHVMQTIFPEQLKQLGDGAADRLQALQAASQAMAEDISEPFLSKMKRNWVYKPMLHLSRR